MLIKGRDDGRVLARIDVIGMVSILELSGRSGFKREQRSIPMNRFMAAMAIVLTGVGVLGRNGSAAAEEGKAESERAGTLVITPADPTLQSSIMSCGGVVLAPPAP